MTNSRAKGCRGEREWRDQLRQAGWDAHRGQQYNGLEGQDVVCPDLEHLHCEVKRTQRLNLYAAMEQATRDGEGKTPYVAHKKNHHKWLVIMWADDFFDLVRESL